MIYRNEDLNILARHFGVIEDPRDNRGKLHRLIDIFILAIYGFLIGHKDFTNMAEELKYRETYFTDLLGLEHGIPSHDTFSAVFGVINPQEFLECFISWIIDIMRAKGKHVAIDGKAVRAACDKVHQKHMPYLVNAYIVDAGLCIGQLRVDEKTNEIKGIPELLEWMDIDESVISIDAIGCQKEIAALIKEKGGDFVLQVKENQPSLRNDIELDMMERIPEKELRDERNKQLKERGYSIASPVDDPLDIYQENERAHSRIERRTYYVLNDNACVNTTEWASVTSVGMVTRERIIVKRDENDNIIDEKATSESSFYIMSKHMCAEEFASYVRGHWGIENSLHWVLDDFFREDRCTARVKHATENIALMRKFTYNLMKLDDNVSKMSMTAKSVYYRNNCSAIENLLFNVIPSRY